MTEREAQSPRINQVCRCIKDGRAEGVGRIRPHESPEAIKVLFLVNTECEPVQLPLFSGDWRAPPCALTACLCASRKTIYSLSPPSGKGKRGEGIPSIFPFLSLFSSCCIPRYKPYCNLRAALSCPGLWFLHGTVENESKWEIEWKSKLSSGEWWIWLGREVGSGTIMIFPFQRVRFDLFLKWMPPYFRCTTWLSQASYRSYEGTVQFPLLLNSSLTQSAV